MMKDPRFFQFQATKSVQGMARSNSRKDWLFKAELTKDLASVEAALFSIGQKAQHKALVKKVQESQKNAQAALKQVTAYLTGKSGAKTELAKVLTQACTALKDLKSKKQMAAKAIKH